MLAFALQGIGIGFTAGVSPGPYQVYLINNALALGWRRTIIAVCSPLIIDPPIILLIVFILDKLPPEFIRVVQILGGLFILWTAYGAVNRLRSGAAILPVDTQLPSPLAPLPEGEGKRGRGLRGEGRFAILRRAMLMNALSPGPYVFWSTVNGPLLVQGLQQSPAHGLAFLIGFYGVFIGMMSLTVLLFDRLRALDERITRGALWVSACLLVLFGVALLAQSVGIIGT